MKDKILVTGGAGFIGSHLVDSLLKDGHSVLVIDNFDSYYDRTIKQNNIKEHVGSPGYQLIEADIRDRVSIDRIFNTWRPDVVIHLAAKAGVRPSIEDPLMYVEVNLLGTINVLDASVKYAVSRFIFASSSSVYGLNDKVPFSENDALLQVASPYGATKAAGEALCRSYSHCFQLPVTALRFFTVYGPRQRPDLAIHKFAAKIRNDEPIPLFGDGSTSRDYTYIDDIISGIRKAIDWNHKGYEAFNLGNDHPTTLLRLVQLLETALNKQAIIEWQPLQTGDVPQTWANVQKAHDFLGYNPSTDLETGICKFVEWMH
ncbi:SDR family NAD(P)-dependent oxidoreductase [Paenibacillus sp. BR2-3]|uniref:SDR family NAD(P)-dependent oxidoreductase n=1 Tax=Paenibacillus sp. BR2-3 TaxID=3048494 RepID=UPI003977C1F0